MSSMFLIVPQKMEPAPPPPTPARFAVPRDKEALPLAELVELFTAQCEADGMDVEKFDLSSAFVQARP